MQKDNLLNLEKPNYICQRKKQFKNENKEAFFVGWLIFLIGYILVKKINKIH